VLASGQAPREGVHRLESKSGLSANLSQHAQSLAAALKPGDTLFTLGAGDIHKLGTAVLEVLSRP
jgi:UDP-N-acetylmuramate-alanine ligase